MSEVTNPALKAFAENTVLPLRMQSDALMVLIQAAVDDYETNLIDVVDGNADDDFIMVDYPNDTSRAVSMARIREVYDQYLNLLSAGLGG